MRELVGLARFMLVLALAVATEALAGDLQRSFSDLEQQLEATPDAVVDQVEELAHQDPDSPRVQVLLGRAHYFMSDDAGRSPEEASRLRLRGIEEMEEGLRRDPTYELGWLKLSHSLEYMREYQRAADAMLRYARFFPKDFNRRRHYIFLISKTGPSDVKLQALRAWIAEVPDCGEAYESLGDFLSKAGKVEEAIEAYRQAVKRGEDVKSPFALGTLLAQRGRWQEAADAFVPAMEGPFNELGKYSRAAALVKVGDMKEARRLLKVIEQDDAHSPTVIKRLQVLLRNPKGEAVVGWDAYDKL